MTASINEAKLVDHLHELDREAKRIKEELDSEKQAARLLAKSKLAEDETLVTLKGSDSNVVDVVFGTSNKFLDGEMATAKKGLGAALFKKLFVESDACVPRIPLEKADIKLLKDALGASEFKRLFAVSKEYGFTPEYDSVYETLDKKRRVLVDAGWKEKAKTPSVKIPKHKPKDEAA